MKVCYVLSTSEITGGANRSILDLLSTLDRKVVDPVVLIKKHGDIENTLKKMNIPVFLIPFINEVSTENPVLDEIKKLNAIKTTKQVVKFLQDQNVEIVHNNSLPALAGMEAANRLEIPYICHIREQVWSGLGFHLLNEKKHFKIVKKAACILAISQFVCEEYKDLLIGCPITVLHDGFNISLYLNEQKRIFDSNLVNVAIYGNLDPQKGQMDAVKAIEILRERGYENIVLHIIGNQQTRYADEVKKYVTVKKIRNIIFSDPIKNIESLKASRAYMDINLVCSNAEGLGRVTVESMLSGCLTIGAKAGATPEIIEDGKTGVLYEAGNYIALAEAINKAINDRSYFSKIAYNGQKFAMKTYSIISYARKIEDIYYSIL